MLEDEEDDSNLLGEATLAKLDSGALDFGDTPKATEESKSAAAAVVEGEGNEEVAEAEADDAIEPVAEAEADDATEPVAEAEVVVEESEVPETE